MFHSNRNQFEQYPFFINKEDIPIKDIRVTSPTTKLLKISSTEIVLDGDVSGTIGTSMRVTLYRDTYPVGHAILAKIPTKEFVGDYPLLPSCIYDDLPINGLGTLNGLFGDILILAGDNVIFEGSLKISYLTHYTQENYLRQLGIIKGNDLVINGREFIRIHGIEFSTAISDAKLLCPVVLAGQGETGGYEEEELPPEPEEFEDEFYHEAECTPPTGDIHDQL